MPRGPKPTVGEDLVTYSTKLRTQTKDQIWAIAKALGVSQRELLEKWQTEFAQANPDVVKKAEKYLALRDED
jgi:hypothetical protein